MYTVRRLVSVLQKSLSYKCAVKKCEVFNGTVCERKIDFLPIASPHQAQEGGYGGVCRVCSFTKSPGCGVHLLKIPWTTNVCAFLTGSTQSSVFLNVFFSAQRRGRSWREGLLASWMVETPATESWWRWTPSRSLGSVPCRGQPPSRRPLLCLVHAFQMLAYNFNTNWALGLCCVRERESERFYWERPDEEHTYTFTFGPSDRLATLTNRAGDWDQRG